MALGADCVLVCGRAELIASKCAVGVVAVAAGHQPFIHLMVKWLGECRPDIGMAGVAKHRLRSLEEAGLSIKFMNAVAAGAAKPGFSMRGALEVGVSAGVATEACFVDLLCRSLIEPEDLCYISAAIDMGFPRPMTAFAGRAFAAVHQGKLGMRICGKALGHVRVAGHAGIGTYIAGRWCCCRCATQVLRRGPLLPILARSIHPRCFPESGQQRNQRHAQEQTFHSSPPAERVPIAVLLGICCGWPTSFLSPHEHKTSHSGLAVMGVTEHEPFHFG